MMQRACVSPEAKRFMLHYITIWRPSKKDAEVCGDDGGGGRGLMESIWASKYK